MIYLVPPLLLALSAILVLMPMRFFHPRRPWLIPVLLVASASLVVAFSLNSGNAAIPWDVWRGPGGQPALKGSYLSFGLVFAILALLVVQLASRDVEPVSAATSLFITAAGLGFLLSSNSIALCLGWGLLDASIILIGVFVHPDTPRNLFRRAILLNFIGGLAWLFFISSSSLQDPAGKIGSLASIAAILFYLAFCLRLSAYPFSLTLSLARELPTFTGGALLLVLLAAGAHLPELAGQLEFRGALSWLWPLLGAIPLLYGGISLWRDQRRPTFHLAQFQIGTLLLLALTGDDEAVLLCATSTLLALASWQVFEEIFPRLCDPRLRLTARGAAILALASLAGIPLTLGFAARSPLLSRGVVLPVLEVLGSAIILPPLLKALSKAELEGRSLEGNRALVSVLSLVALSIPLLLLGVYASFKEAGSGVMPWLIALIPLFLGYLGFRLWDRIVAKLAPFLEAFDYLELEWLYGRLEEGGGLVIAALREMAVLLETRRSLGWLVLALVIVIIYLGV